MENVVLVIHLFLALALIGVILLQPSSDGGGLTSSSSSFSGFMTPRGSANLLTRTTGILAFLFMITSLSLVVISGSHKKESVLDQIEKTDAAVPAVPAVPVDAPKADAAKAGAPAVPVGR